MAKKPATSKAKLEIDKDASKKDNTPKLVTKEKNVKAKKIKVPKAITLVDHPVLTSPEKASGSRIKGWAPLFLAFCIAAAFGLYFFR
jgi:hypothetical protein